MEMNQNYLVWITLHSKCFGYQQRKHGARCLDQVHSMTILNFNSMKEYELIMNFAIQNQ